jgi:1-deoxy-D-xylulose-5-phosphate reductoisomerase
LAPPQIEVVIHRESVIHSMIEFCDGSILAQLAVPDMRIPIQYALTHPERLPANGGDLTLNLTTQKCLHFEAPNARHFPCLDLAREALARGSAWTCSLNAADEIAVEAFLDKRLPFTAIPRVIASVLERTSAARFDSIDNVLACDREARERARLTIEQFQD